ncbi:unnamed protein product [Urochloa decumbens]|uniref:Uncharacterized protein n=1 Tax=Urochloa decumbens TaxID=240449 RepID=A0ABC9GTW7_9POAL
MVLFAVVLLLGDAGVDVVGACCANFLWRAATPTPVAMMKAPGAAGGLHISREAFEANPKLYFKLLRRAGVKAAAAAFAA